MKYKLEKLIDFESCSGFSEATLTKREELKLEVPKATLPEGLIMSEADDPWIHIDIKDGKQGWKVVKTETMRRSEFEKKYPPIDIEKEMKDHLNLIISMVVDNA